MTTLYIDMDGVVADFNEFARQVLRPEKYNPTVAKWDKQEWSTLKDYPHLYRNLPKTAMADQLISLARQFRDQKGWDLYFLTAVPQKDDVPDAFYDKVCWVQDYYPDIAVRFGPHSYEKQKHCKPGDILVDDRISNCAEWTAAGGIAVRVTRDYDSVLAQLQDILISL
jgi:5'(3')-deoxyribonucleotidase